MESTMTIKKLIMLLMSLACAQFAYAKENEHELNIVPIREVYVDKLPSIAELEGDHCEEPIIFRGVAKDWEPVAWTWEMLLEKFGKESCYSGRPEMLEIIPLLINEPQLPDSFKEKLNLLVEKEKYYDLCVKDHDFDSSLCQNESSALYDYLTSMLSLNECYEFIINNPNLENHLDLYFDGIEGSNFTSGATTFETDSCFIGGPNHYVDLHNHEATLLSEFFGAKLATLVSPGDGAYIGDIKKSYLFGAHIEEHHLFDERNPDFDKYPEAKRAKFYQGMLQKGDVLYIPENWYHSLNYKNNSYGCAQFFSYSDIVPRNG